MSEPVATNLARIRNVATLSRAGTVFILLTMFIGTHIPSTVTFYTPTYTDKVIHLLAYMVLTISALASWELSTGQLQPQHYFRVWLFGTIWGAIDEFTQPAVGRHCDGLDWIADMLGIVVGLTVFRLARPLMYRWILPNQA